MSDPVLPAAVHRHAAAHPLAVAVRDASGEMTWAALDGAAQAVAAGIDASDVAPGERVVLLAEPSADAVAALVGILRAGAVAVPVGTRLRAREVAAAVAEVSPALVVHDGALAGLAAAAGLPSTILSALAGRAADGPPRAAVPDPDAADGPPRAAVPDPDAAAVAVLTSGTTGCPKAALLSHRALATSTRSWTEALPPATGWLLCLGLAHVAGLGIAWRALGAGVPLTVVAPFDATRTLAALAGPDAPSHVSLVPAQLARLLDAAGDRPAPPGLRAVLLGGAPIPPELVARATAAGWPIVPTYGLTEAGSGVTALLPADAAAHPGSAGTALAGVTVRVVDAGADGVGAIEVRTPAAFIGYLGRPDETAAAFTPDGWLRTGDLGRLDQAARLEVVDRRADLIISGGENVVPAEVEAVLAAHPALAEAGVAGRPHPEWGTVPVAGIVLRPGVADPGDDALRAWCRASLASYKVPAAFVRLAELPRTAAGKLRRQALRDQLTPLVVVLHATLSTGRQLAPLVRALTAPGDLRVIAPDRRGSGERRLDPPRPVAMDEHLADLAALLDDAGAEQAVLVGHSFGGVLAVEAAARLPERVAAVVAYEPPYGAIGDARVRRAFALVAARTARAGESDGPAGAARAFLAGVAGPRAWDTLPGRTRAFLEAQGGGAVADAAMTGLEPDGLARIACPVAILTGEASEAFYGPLADTLAAHIPGARRVELPGLRHAAPITDPAVVAAAVRAALAAARVVPLPLETPA